MIILLAIFIFLIPLIYSISRSKRERARELEVIQNKIAAKERQARKAAKAASEP